jgi:hypothetical protein
MIVVNTAVVGFLGIINNEIDRSGFLKTESLIKYIIVLNYILVTN